MFKEQVVSELKKGRSVLITGKYGSGRSHLLQEIVNELGLDPGERHGIYMATLNVRKQFLLEAAQVLHQKENLGETLGQFKYIEDFSDVKKELLKFGVSELADAVIKPLSQYVLCIDDVHLATEKTIKEVLLEFIRAGGVLLLAAIDDSKTEKKRLNLIRNKCVQLEMVSMSKDEAKDMLWKLLDKDEYKNHAMIEAKILNLYNGLPGVVADTALKLAATTGTVEDVRNLTHSDMQPINVTWSTFFVVLGLAAVARFTSRQLNDPIIYMTAGVAYVLMMISPRLLNSWKK